jgi:putative methanogen marker protein 4
LDSSFVNLLEEKARSRRARIGIGLWNADSELLSGLRSATEYADLVVVGNSSPIPGARSIPTEDPCTKLVDLLENGEIDGAVRGNLPAHRTMRCLSRRFNAKVRRLALLDLDGWSFFLGPVGIDEGETISDRLGLAVDGARYLEHLGIKPKVSILSGGRMEDLGRSEKVDRSLADGELIAFTARSQGISATHRGILIESCKGDDLLIAPEGISGNLVFRTLLLLCGAKALGAPVMMDEIFVDSSRSRGDYTGPVVLASALADIRKR